MGYRLDINIVDVYGNEKNVYYGTKLIGYVKHAENLNCVKYLIESGVVPEEHLDYFKCGSVPTYEISYEELCIFINLYCYDLVNASINDDYYVAKNFEQISNLIDLCHDLISTVSCSCDTFDTITIGWC